MLTIGTDNSPVLSYCVTLSTSKSRFSHIGNPTRFFRRLIWCAYIMLCGIWPLEHASEVLWCSGLQAFLYTATEGIFRVSPVCAGCWNGSVMLSPITRTPRCGLLNDEHVAVFAEFYKLCVLKPDWWNSALCNIWKLISKLRFPGLSTVQLNRSCSQETNLHFSIHKLKPRFLLKLLGVCLKFQFGSPYSIRPL